MNRQQYLLFCFIETFFHDFIFQKYFKIQMQRTFVPKSVGLLLSPAVNMRKNTEQLQLLNENITWSKYLLLIITKAWVTSIMIKSKIKASVQQSANKQKYWLFHLIGIFFLDFIFQRYFQRQIQKTFRLQILYELTNAYKLRLIQYVEQYNTYLCTLQRNFPNVVPEYSPWPKSKSFASF